jgi:hypothetical protein
MTPPRRAPEDRLTPLRATILVCMFPLVWPARLVGMICSACAVGYLAGYRYVRGIAEDASTYHG